MAFNSVLLCNLIVGLLHMPLFTRKNQCWIDEKCVRQPSFDLMYSRCIWSPPGIWLGIDPLPVFLISFLQSMRFTWAVSLTPFLIFIASHILPCSHGGRRPPPRPLVTAVHTCHLYHLYTLPRTFAFMVLLMNPGSARCFHGFLCLPYLHICPSGSYFLTPNIWMPAPSITLLYYSCPCGSPGKESACNAGDWGLIPGLGRSPREGKGYPLQYSALKNSMDCIVHGVAKSWTLLSDFHFHYYSSKSLIIF